MHEKPGALLEMEGYHPAYDFRYSVYVTRICHVLFWVSGGIFYLVWWAAVQKPFVGIPYWVLFWIVIFVYGTSDFLRRLIQRGMSRFLGYRISYTFDLVGVIIQPETYTGDPGQLQKRGVSLLIAVAPLVLFLLLWLPLFIGLQGMVGDILAYFLFVYVAGTLGDVYFIWRLLRMPGGTVLYTVNRQEKLIFEPGV